jgi:hypothetical protein
MIEQLLLNYYTLSVFVTGICALVFWDLRRPWGYVFPIAGVAALLLFLPGISNPPMRFVVAYGGFGLLLCFSEWVAGRQKRL